MHRQRTFTILTWLLGFLALLLLSAPWWAMSWRTVSLANAPLGLRLTVRQPNRWLWGRRPTLLLRIQQTRNDTPSAATLHIQARVELPGLAIHPPGTQTLVLSSRQGREATLRWQLHAPTPGTYQGRLWVTVSQTSHPGGQPVIAMPLRGEALAPGGCSVTCLQWAALGLLVLTIVLGLWARRKSATPPP